MKILFISKSSTEVKELKDITECYKIAKEKASEHNEPVKFYNLENLAGITVHKNDKV